MIPKIGPTLYLNCRSHREFALRVTTALVAGSGLDAWEAIGRVMAS